MASALNRFSRLLLVMSLCVLAGAARGADSRSTHHARPTSAKELQANPHNLVAQVMHNELNADLHDHSLWMYVCEKTDDNKKVTRKVIETPKGDLSLTTAQGGHPLSPEELKKEESQLDKLVHDPSALSKKQKDEHEDDAKARELMKMLPTAFIYQYEGQQDGIVRLSFRPNPQFNPPTREAKVFHAMAGEMKVQAREKRLVQLSGHLIEDVDFGMGILGKLHKGGTFELDRVEPAPGHWKTSLIDVHLSGRALFFKSISENQHEVDRDYHQVPVLSADRAAKALERQTDVAQLSGSASRK